MKQLLQWSVAFLYMLVTVRVLCAVALDPKPYFVHGLPDHDGYGFSVSGFGVWS